MKNLAPCLFVLVALIAIGGCNRGPHLVTVTGKLTLGDKPCEGVTVVLSPEDVSKMCSMASTMPDGSFTLMTAFGKPGTPPGPYIVSISIPLFAAGGGMVPSHLQGRESPWKITIADKPQQSLVLDMEKDEVFLSP